MTQDDQYVYAFADAAEVPRKLLGGKGAGLADMTQLGLPVPDGFTITTAACVARDALRRRLARAGSPSRSTPRVRSARGALRPPARRRGASRCSSPCARARPSRCPG